ncbi:MAG: M3 family oligoendopeptidase [Ruminococcaceae bacterium]|nr:M3 family oligoendopeptidase [Oscillospiraceae bacterium]
MKFSEMKYERVDMALLGEKYDKLTLDIKQAKNAEDVFSAIDEHEKISSNFATMSTLAYVRHSINTKDEFYDKENDFYDKNGPLLQEKTTEFMKALLVSPFRNEVEKKHGSLLFKNLEMELKTFSPEIIPLLQKENKLVSDYQKLIASAQIDFDNKKLNISQLGVYKVDKDRDVRKRAFEAEGNFYMSHADTLDTIFDELVKVRTEIARKLGFKNFTELGYMRRTRNCYTPEMVKNFREQVKKDLVPIVTKIKKEQAKTIGVDNLMLYDNSTFYLDGNPKPAGTPEDILAAGKKMYEEMSPETNEFINFMYDNELLDVLAKEGKAVGGYCITIPDYKAPFIFSNFNGTAGDVEVLTHEAGHAFADYTVRNFELEENKNPSMESCETHSMSMEFFAWPWLDLFYKEDTKRAKLTHLKGALIFIPYGCIVDEFQHIVYDNPDMTPAQRHEAWADLERQYRPYIDMTGVPFYSEGRGWQRQLHIYHYPFYYIDYCLAQTESLIFRGLSQNDYKDAWDRYMKFVKEGGKKTFVELCEVAGIKTPFEDGALREIAVSTEKWLEENKL